MFAPELPGLDRDRIREWCNGYSSRGDEKVDNPFDILLLFHSREFEAHWLETGAPVFLVETLFRQRVRSMDLDGLRELFHAFYASIPHQRHTNNDIARYEGYYASVFYSYFAGLGL